MTPLHGIGGRQDLPLPFEYVLVGAGAAVAVTFVVVLWAWKKPRWRDDQGIPMPRLTRFMDHHITRVILRLFGLGCAGWAVFALVAGPDRLTNPIFGVLYVWLWVGLVPLSLLFGPLWRLINPVRTMATWAASLPRHQLQARFDKIGLWPAAFAVAGFTWLELVQPDNTTVFVVGVWVAAWVVVVVGGAMVFGPRWIASADPFEAYAQLVSKLSVWHRHDGIIHLVNPLRNVTRWSAPPGTLAVVSVLLGSTAFDSLAATSSWISHTQLSSIPAVAWNASGLAALIGFVAVSFWTTTRVLGHDEPRRLAPSLIPLVVGYSLGHYFSMWIIEGQRTLVQWSDPLGQGWNVFGTAEWGINTWLFDFPMFTATAQLAFIVVGHVLGVIIAHDLSLDATHPGWHRQIPLLLTMVFYTVAGLLLLYSG